MKYYFAYGTNMSMEDMAIRCPTAIPAGWARLPGWRLIINTDGWPTIIPHPQATLYGGLWKLSADDEAALDHYEDVAGGLYSKQQMSVSTRDNQCLTARVYVAANSTEGTRAEKNVIKNILNGVEQFGLPDNYKNYLKNHFDEGEL